MKTLDVVPEGKPIPLTELKTGLFLFEETLAFKSEYGKGEIFVCSTGELFWGGQCTREDLAKLIVQPVKSCWVERLTIS